VKLLSKNSGTARRKTESGLRGASKENKRSRRKGEMKFAKWQSKVGFTSENYFRERQ